MSDDSIDHAAMEAARPTIQNWSMIQEAVSLLLSIMILILGQRWNVSEAVASESSWMLRRSAYRTRSSGSGDYTYLYNQLTISDAWQRPRFSTSPGSTPFSWLRGRFRRRNPILRRRSSGRAFLGSCSIRRSIVFSTIWKVLTRFYWTRARSSGPSPAIRDCEDCSRVVSGSVNALAVPESLLILFVSQEHL